jgi:thiol-disulfide isomerase/thioredoxin
MKLREPMPSLEGATHTLNDTITKEDLMGDAPTLIHFWSVSCHLCKEAMPEVNELRDEYDDRLNVVAIHMPRSEDDLDLAVIEKVAESHDIIQPILVDNAHAITDSFENKYVPAYYIFDKEGKLRHFQAGGSGMAMLRKRLERVLNEA